MLSYDSSPAFTRDARTARRPRRRRCWTPASARSSTPACSTGADNPDGGRALVDFLLTPDGCRRRCPRACTSSRSGRRRAARGVGAGSRPQPPRTRTRSTRPRSPPTARSGWIDSGPTSPSAAELRHWSRRSRCWSSAVFFVLPVVGMIAQRLHGRRQARRGRRAGGAGRGRGSTGCCGSRCGRPPRRPRCRCCSACRRPTLLHRLRLPGARRRAGAGAGAVRAADRRGRGGLPAAARRGGPLGFLGLDGSAAAIVAGADASSTSAVVVRAVGHRRGSTLDPRPGEAAAALGASPAAGVPHGDAAGAAAGDRCRRRAVVFLFCATAFGVVLILGGLALQHASRRRSTCSPPTCSTCRRPRRSRCCSCWWSCGAAGARGAAAGERGPHRGAAAGHGRTRSAVATCGALVVTALLLGFVAGARC